MSAAKTRGQAHGPGFVEAHAMPSVLYKATERHLDFDKQPGLHLGVTLACIRKRFYVAHVSRKTQAWRLGLEVGDRLEGVNNLSLKDTHRNGTAVTARRVLDLLWAASHVSLVVTDRCLPADDVCRYVERRALRPPAACTGRRASWPLAEPLTVQTHRGGPEGVDPCLTLVRTRSIDLSSTHAHTDDDYGLCLCCRADRPTDTEWLGDHLYAAPDGGQGRRLSAFLSSVAQTVFITPWKEAAYYSNQTVIPSILTIY